MRVKSYFILMLMTLLTLLAGCGIGSAKGGGESFTAASAKNTDSKINVQILKLLVEDQTDHKVEIVQDLPASPQIFSGMERGEFDFASLFSGEVYNNYFDDIEYTTDPEETLAKAQKLFGEKYDVKWYDPIGYINNYSIAIKGNFAEENNIETLTDLGKYADELTLGTDNAWVERDNDGYKGFQKAYGYEFGDVRAMDVALMYKGIETGDIDVATVYTVDPQLIEHDLTVVEDDKHFFPPYEGSLVASNEVVDEYEEVDEIAESITGLVDTEEMTDLIYQVEIEEKNMTKVVEEFLQEEGMLD